MKKLFSTLLVISLVGCAGMQQVREEDKTFARAFDAPGYKKDVLYEKIKIWVAQNFKSAKAVLEYENKENGTLIGNGIVSYPCSGLGCIGKTEWKIPFTMQVDIKDEKFRLTFTNLRLTWPATSDSLGYHAAHDGALWQQGDYDATRPILLKFGEEIKTSLEKAAVSDQW